MPWTGTSSPRSRSMSSATSRSGAPAGIRSPVGAGAAAGFRRFRSQLGQRRHRRERLERRAARYHHEAAGGGPALVWTFTPYTMRPAAASRPDSSGCAALVRCHAPARAPSRFPSYANARDLAFPVTSRAMPSSTRRATAAPAVGGVWPSARAASGIADHDLLAEAARARRAPSTRRVPASHARAVRPSRTSSCAARSPRSAARASRASAAKISLQRVIGRARAARGSVSQASVVAPPTQSTSVTARAASCAGGRSLGLAAGRGADARAPPARP